MRDDSAASPLVVIGTFVLVAAAITAVAMMLIIETPDRDIDLVDGRTTDGQRYLEVSRAVGGVRWDGLQIALWDPAGRDVASTYLEIPSGAVEVGDRILLRHALPAGVHLLVASEGGEERVRLAISG